MAIILPLDDFDSSLADIIEYALLEINAISLGETIDAEVLEKSVYRFNTLVFSLVNEKVPLHAIDTQTITGVLDTSNYATLAHTTRVLSFDDADLNVITGEDYDKLLAGPNNGESYVYIDYGNSPPTLKFINGPEVDSVVTYRRERSPMAITASDSTTYPLEAIEMLILGLAWKLAPSYKVPAQKRMEVQADYEDAKRMYMHKQTQREGDEIVVPSFVV